MDGEYVGGSRVKLGFGKPVATTCVWVDGLTEHTEKQVRLHFIIAEMFYAQQYLLFKSCALQLTWIDVKFFRGFCFYCVKVRLRRLQAERVLVI